MAVTPLMPVILCGGTGTRLWPLSRARVTDVGHTNQTAPLGQIRRNDDYAMGGQWADFAPASVVRMAFNYPYNHPPWAVHHYMAELLSEVVRQGLLGACAAAGGGSI